MERLFEASIIVIPFLLAALWFAKYILDARNADLASARRELQALQTDHQRQNERLAALMALPRTR